jgi:multidrug efflux system outer membrane protein
MISRNLHLPILLSAACLLASCVNGVGPNYVQPERNTARAFLASHSADAVTNDPPPAEWWKSLNDDQLNDLVGRALRVNNDVLAAKANLDAARAATRSVKGGFFPSVNANASYARAKESAAAQGLATELPAVDVYDGTFDASWEIDIFGRINRNVQAARADAQATEASLNDVLVSVVADTVRAYVELRGAQVRLDVARRNAENQKGTYNLTIDLSNGGRGSELDVARAQSQYETTLASIAALEAAEAAAQYRLAVLVGEQPQQFTLPSGRVALPVVPASISIGDPAELLRRRPDVRRAERQLEAATARIGVATADLFPRLSLTGAVGLSALSFDNLSEQAAFQYSIGPSLVWNLFAGGATRARIDQADAQTKAQLAKYDAAILLALEDAEASLARFGRERVRLGHLSSAALASARAADFADQRYRGGIDNFLNVLDAQRSLLAAEDALVQSQVAAVTQFIAVHKALGVGWQAATQ